MFKWLSVIFVLILIFAGCGPKVIKKETIAVKKYYPEKRVLTVKKENIRDMPNGYVIGELKKGDPVLVLNKMANWIVYDYYPDEKGYVWAPSLGYVYLNLYSPFTYIDSDKQKFINIEHLNFLLGQTPDVIQSSGNLSHLKYSGLGLGKRVEEVMEVVKVKKQVVEKTVMAWFDKSKNNITEIQVDLFHPVSGKNAAIKKAGIKDNYKIVEDSDSRIVVQLTGFSKPFFLVLKRKEWKSDQFIGYSIATKY